MLKWLLSLGQSAAPIAAGNWPPPEQPRQFLDNSNKSVPGYWERQAKISGRLASELLVDLHITAKALAEIEALATPSCAHIGKRAAVIAREARNALAKRKADALARETV